MDPTTIGWQNLNSRYSNPKRMCTQLSDMIMLDFCVKQFKRIF